MSRVPPNPSQKLRGRLAAVVLLCAAAAVAAENEPASPVAPDAGRQDSPVPQEAVQTIALPTADDGTVNGPALARRLTQVFMSDEQWRSEVDECRRRFADWDRDNDGDMGTYLNDRFITVALSARNGQIEKIKKGLAWLAMYQEFRQQPPRLVTKFLAGHQGSLNALLTDFTLVKASLYIRNKEWRADLEEPRKLTAEAAPSADVSQKP